VISLRTLRKYPPLSPRAPLMSARIPRCAVAGVSATQSAPFFMGRLLPRKALRRLLAGPKSRCCPPPHSALPRHRLALYDFQKALGDLLLA